MRNDSAFQLGIVPQTRSDLSGPRKGRGRCNPKEGSWATPYPFAWSPVLWHQLTTDSPFVN